MQERRTPTRQASGRKGWRHQCYCGSCFSLSYQWQRPGRTIPLTKYHFMSQQENPPSVGQMSWLIWVGLESFPSPELSGSACFCFPYPSVLITHADSSQPLVFLKWSELPGPEDLGRSSCLSVAVQTMAEQGQTSCSLASCVLHEHHPFSLLASLWEPCRH